MSTVRVVAGEDGHTCRQLVPDASTAGNMSASSGRAVWARRRVLHVRGHGQIPKPPASGLPKPCFVDIFGSSTEQGFPSLASALP